MTSTDLDPALRARAIAFYLPQYHPIPENDEWWGPGFTEWTNTAKARPLFEGHVQPTLPADLGFYDLRLPEAREAQSELAQQYGIEAFCYWHYWFGNGRRILERPFAEVLKSGRPSISFCLGWANQTWTGIWHGAPGRVLIEQSYPGPEDERAHFDLVLEAFRDERYLRVDDRPVFYVYRPGDLPNAADFVDRWQAMARAAGLPGLYLVAEACDFRGLGTDYYTSYDADGFDAAAYMRLPVDGPAIPHHSRFGSEQGPEVYTYAEQPIRMPAGIDTSRLQPAVMPNWDNTPRAQERGVVLADSSPEKFRVQLREAVSSVADRSPEQRLVWIKSWNEWAEGNHLEPDLVHGRRWLEVVHEELSRGSRSDA